MKVLWNAGKDSSPFRVSCSEANSLLQGIALLQLRLVQVACQGTTICEQVRNVALPGK